MLWVERWLRMCGDIRYKVFRSGFRRLQVFRSNFQDVFEIGANFGKFALEENNNLPDR